MLINPDKTRIISTGYEFFYKRKKSGICSFYVKKNWEKSFICELERTISDKLSNDDLDYLKNYKSDGSLKSDLLCLSSKLLQKQKLSVLEESALE